MAAFFAWKIIRGLDYQESEPNELEEDKEPDHKPNIAQKPKVKHFGWWRFLND